MLKFINGFHKKFSREGGFTLIELLVVIAIIGILASIVLASLNTARRKSRDVRRIADIKQIQLALELYFDKNQTYPLVITGTNLAPEFIPTVPKDPSSASLNYSYDPVTTWTVATPSVGTVCTATPCLSYHLGATLAETSNSALSGDIDGDTGFNGASGAAEGTACAAIAGADSCYDVHP